MRFVYKIERIMNAKFFRLLSLLLFAMGALYTTGCGGGGSSAQVPTSTNAQPSFFDEGYSAPTAYSNNFCTDNNYPAQWEWNPSSTQGQPLAATSGTPTIKHIRNGIVIASYTQLAGDRSAADNTSGKDATVGPFRRAPYTQWRDGDVFEIYPAVYEGEDQQIYIGPNYDNNAAYTATQQSIPKNITIRGITVNGYRPVIKLPSTGASNNTLGQGLIYVGKSENITIENIDVVSNDTDQGSIGKAGIYINGGLNATLRNVRVSGFKNKSANGIFGTTNNSGTLTLENIELSNNGGGGGPEHNIYINASSLDNNFTVKLKGSWSHDSYYGHLFKSRAQINVLEGNYFQGSKSNSGEMRESWLVDVPDGGTLIAKNNIFVKTFSGNSTNGASITFAVEKSAGNYDKNRPWALRIEHNTFVAFSRYFDDLKHETYPLFLKMDTPILSANHSVKNNIFIGYCQTPSQTGSASTYRGDNYLIANFNEIDQSFRPRSINIATSTDIVGTPNYLHRQRWQLRRTTAIGAKD